MARFLPIKCNICGIEEEIPVTQEMSDAVRRFAPHWGDMCPMCLAQHAAVTAGSS